MEGRRSENGNGGEMEEQELTGKRAWRGGGVAFDEYGLFLRWWLRGEELRALSKEAKKTKCGEGKD